MQTSLPGVQQLHFDLAEQLTEGTFRGYLVFDIGGFHDLNARQGYKTDLAHLKLILDGDR